MLEFEVNSSEKRILHEAIPKGWVGPWIICWTVCFKEAVSFQGLKRHSQWRKNFHLSKLSMYVVWCMRAYDVSWCSCVWVRSSGKVCLSICFKLLDLSVWVPVMVGMLCCEIVCSWTFFGRCLWRRLIFVREYTLGTCRWTTVPFFWLCYRWYHLDALP